MDPPHSPKTNPSNSDAIPGHVPGPEEVQTKLLDHRKNSTKLIKCIHHLKFLEKSISDNNVPKGLQINLKINAVDQDNTLNENIRNILEKTQIAVMEDVTD